MALRLQIPNQQRTTQTQGTVMLISEEAKLFIQNLQSYLADPENTTYQLIIGESGLSLLPRASTSFAESIYNGEEILLGLDAETQKQLRGRTLILKTIGKTTSLELLERRRKPREYMT